MKNVSAPGTITREDNTTPRPDPDGPCKPSTRLGCGTFPLARKPAARVTGYDSRRISVHLANRFEPGRECLIGNAVTWVGPQRLVGGDREGQLLIKMPSESAFRRRRVVRLHGQTHKTSRYSDGPLDFETNDITRKATVTFTRR